MLAEAFTIPGITPLNPMTKIDAFSLFVKFKNLHEFYVDLQIKN